MVSTHTIFSVLLLSGSALAGNSRQINPKNARLTAREVAILNALDQRSDYWLDLAPRSSSPDGPPAPTVKRRSSKGSTGSPPAVSASSSGDEKISTKRQRTKGEPNSEQPAKISSPGVASSGAQSSASSSNRIAWENETEDAWNKQAKTAKGANELMIWWSHASPAQRAKVPESYRKLMKIYQEVLAVSDEEMKADSERYQESLDPQEVPDGKRASSSKGAGSSN